VERRAVAIINRSCAYPACVNPGEGDPYDGGYHTCKNSCGDHYTSSEVFSSLPNGKRWYRAGDDVWVIQHPAGWYIDSVNLETHWGTTYSATPQESGPLHTLLTVHWQDSQEDEVAYSGGRRWHFIAYYDISATMVGPKGTWPP